LPTKKKNKKKDENTWKQYLLIVYLLLCSSYRHVIAIVLHISSFANLKEDPQLLIDLW
jgi:hypothetical protein